MKWILQGRRRWLVGVALFLLAFWPRLVNLDSLPDSADARAYHEEAHSTFWLMHDNPFDQAFLGLFMQQLRLSGWQEQAGSCEGGSTSLSHLRNIRVEATAIGPWGIPLMSDAITCGGAGWHRDADFVPEPLKSPSSGTAEGRIEVFPPPTPGDAAPTPLGSGANSR